MRQTSPLSNLLIFTLFFVSAQPRIPVLDIVYMLLSLFFILGLQEYMVLWSCFHSLDRQKVPL